MTRSGKSGILAAAITAFALVVAAPLPALAAFAVNIVGPGAYVGGITVNDNDPGDLDPTSGVINIVAGAALTTPPIPGFIFSVDTAASNSPGGPLSSKLSLGWVLGGTSPGGGSIVVTASATDFDFPPSGANSTLISSVGGNASEGSVTAQQWVDLANGLFFLGTVTPDAQGPFTTDPFSSIQSATFTSPAKYSITDQLSLSVNAGASINGGLESTVVPEPVTMFLGGTGLLMLTYAARRRLFGG